MNIQQDNSKQNARTRHIDIRLTQKEYEAIVEKAAECGLTPVSYTHLTLPTTPYV